MTRLLYALLLTLALGLEWSDPEAERDQAPAITCAACMDEEECDRLCGVPACTYRGETGCWTPVFVGPYDEKEGEP